MKILYNSSIIKNKIKENTKIIPKIKMIINFVIKEYGINEPMIASIDDSVEKLRLQIEPSYMSSHGNRHSMNAGSILLTIYKEESFCINLFTVKENSSNIIFEYDQRYSSSNKYCINRKIHINDNLKKVLIEKNLCNRKKIMTTPLSYEYYDNNHCYDIRILDNNYGKNSEMLTNIIKEEAVINNVFDLYQVITSIISPEKIEAIIARDIESNEYIKSHDGIVLEYQKNIIKNNTEYIVNYDNGSFTTTRKGLVDLEESDLSFIKKRGSRIF